MLKSHTSPWTYRRQEGRFCCSGEGRSRGLAHGFNDYDDEGCIINPQAEQIKLSACKCHLKTLCVCVCVRVRSCCVADDDEPYFYISFKNGDLPLFLFSASAAFERREQTHLSLTSSIQSSFDDAEESCEFPNGILGFFTLAHAPSPCMDFFFSFIFSSRPTAIGRSGPTQRSPADCS